MTKKSNKQLLAENASLRAQLSAIKSLNEDSNSVASSQRRNRSQDSQRSLATDAEEIANLDFSHPVILEHRGIKDEQQTQNAEFLVRFNKLAKPIWAPLSYMNVKAYENIFMSYCFKFKELHPLIGINMKWKLTKESMNTPTADQQKPSSDSMLSHGPMKEVSTPKNINPKVKISSKIKEIKTNKHSSKLSNIKESTKINNDQEIPTDSPTKSTRSRTNRGVNPRYLP